MKAKIWEEFPESFPERNFRDVMWETQGCKGLQIKMLTEKEQKVSLNNSSKNVFVEEKQL